MIFQTKMQIDAHFNLSLSESSVSSSGGVSKQIINAQIVKVLITVLYIALRNSLVGAVFDHTRFLGAVEKIWQFAKSGLGDKGVTKSQNIARLESDEGNQLIQDVLNNVIQAEILGQPIAELCKSATRE